MKMRVTATKMKALLQVRRKRKNDLATKPFNLNQTSTISIISLTLRVFASLAFHGVLDKHRICKLLTNIRFICHSCLYNELVYCTKSRR